MDEQKGLDQVAQDYLLAPGNNREHYHHALVQAGATAIFPLLRAGIHMLSGTSLQQFMALAQQAQTTEHGEEFIVQMWIVTAGSGVTTDIHQIVIAIGQPALDALCRAFWEQDKQVKMLAALVLTEEQNFSPQTMARLQDAFAHVWNQQSGQEHISEDSPLMLLTTMLAHGGSVQHKKGIDGLAQGMNITPSEFENRARNIAWLYLWQQVVAGG